MRIVVTGAAVAYLLVVAPSAVAATEVGTNCAATASQADTTIFQHSLADDGVTSVPEPGVITSWRVTSAYTEPLEQRLSVLRPTGNGNEVYVVAESGDVLVGAESRGSPARIPVLAGDRVALTGPVEVLYCLTGDESDVVGVTLGPLAPGTTIPFGLDDHVQAPVSAIVEPDADGDGYGDETQDGCPQSASIQSGCLEAPVDRPPPPALPPMNLDAFALVKSRSVLVLVNASPSSHVTVAARVTLPGRRTGVSRSLTLAPQTHVVGPGKLGRFTLRFPRALKRALAKLPAKRSLRLRISASGADTAGRKVTVELSRRLRGGAKPAQRR